MEEIRIRAIHAVQERQHPEEVVRALGFGKRSIYNWLAAYRIGGLGALKAKKLFGRPMKLRPAQLKRLYDLVADQTQLQHLFESAPWKIALVRWLIWANFPVKLSRSSTHRFLQHLGLSCQRLLYRACEQDAARVEPWKQGEYPQIQQMVRQAGAEIWFSDEWYPSGESIWPTDRAGRILFRMREQIERETRAARRGGSGGVR
mgnify:CR=1 FL=1